MSEMVTVMVKWVLTLALWIEQLCLLFIRLLIYTAEDGGVEP
jgi:hypothetical protein